MAYLTKCSLCGRNVSSECNSCPGCGHNVALEVRQKEFEKAPIEERIVGSWETTDPNNSFFPLTINRDSTYIFWHYDRSGISFRGSYSISGDRFNIISRYDDENTAYSTYSVKISLKGDTLLWTNDYNNKTYAYKRR